MSPPDPGQPGPPTLEYGQRAPLAWIGRYRWRLVLLAVCIAVAVPVYRNWRPLKQRVLWLYWSHRAATFQMPGGIELVVTDPEQAKKLLATNPDFVPSDVPGSAAYIPLVLRRLRELDGRFGASASAGPMMGKGSCEAVAFMGAMRRPDGMSRLVVLDGAIIHAPGLMSNTLLIAVPLPHIFDPLQAPTTSIMGTASWNRTVFTSAELRGGVLDPNDPSHVILEFVAGAWPPQGLPAQMNTAFKPSVADHLSDDEIAFRGTIDAYLQNDDSMRLALRQDRAPIVAARWSNDSMIEGNLLPLWQMQRPILDTYFKNHPPFPQPVPKFGSTTRPTTRRIIRFQNAG